MAESLGSVIVLFGAPTVGKDTVTAVLTARSPRFQHFVKHKRGSGSRHGYTVVTEAELQVLRDAGRIVSEVDRYGSTYAIERERLKDGVASGNVMLVHSAEPAEARILVAMGAKLVLLECTRDTAAQRLRLRDPNTVDARLAVWDLVASRLDELAPIANLRLATDDLSPDEVADHIDLLG